MTDRSKLSAIVRDLQEGIGEPVWEPLERFCRSVLYEEDAASGFMFMGAALGPEGDRLIYLYKHGITRRYVNLDRELKTYSYRGDRGGPDAFGDPIYKEISINDAIARLDLASLPKMGAELTTPYDNDYKERRDAALREAGWEVIS